MGEIPDWVKKIEERRQRDLADPDIPKMPCSQCGKPVILRGSRAKKIVGIICQDCTLAML